MSIYFRFRNCNTFRSLSILQQFIAVRDLKQLLLQTTYYGRGNDFDLVLSDAQSNEDYTDEDTLIRRYSSVIVRRIPGRPRIRFRAHGDQVKAVNNIKQNITEVAAKLFNQNITEVAGELPTTNPEEPDWDDFGCDPFAILPEGQPAQSFNLENVSSSDKVDDDNSKLQASLQTSSLDQSSQDEGPRGRGFGQSSAERCGLSEHMKPPPGYVCHRCGEPGHLIKYCPTNGVPAFDPRRFRRPTGVPKSMLRMTPDGTPAVVPPDEAAFQKAIEGIPSLGCTAALTLTEVLREIPRCPICKEVIKDVVLTSKCCFYSFCDKCIRNYIINKSRCVCGSKDVRADDLVPNNTLRRTIDEILERSATSSREQASSLVHVQDTQSSTPVQDKVSFTAFSGMGGETKGEDTSSRDDAATIIKHKPQAASSPDSSLHHSSHRSKRSCTHQDVDPPAAGELRRPSKMQKRSMVPMP